MPYKRCSDAPVDEVDSMTQATIFDVTQGHTKLIDQSIEMRLVLQISNRLMLKLMNKALDDSKMQIFAFCSYSSTSLGPSRQSHFTQTLAPGCSRESMHSQHWNTEHLNDIIKGYNMSPLINVISER